MPSANYNDRPEGMAVDAIIIHYTGMPSLEDALSRLCSAESKVSAHYTISRTGDIYHHVDEEKRAWHAGVSFWRGRENVNDFSIGIELENPGHEFGYIPFTTEQIDALIYLCASIYSRHPIDPQNVVGHEDIAPNRKQDPGSLFPWDILTKHGLSNRTT
jgi:N-acetylmuramoyl-L-alanine amidase